MELNFTSEEKKAVSRILLQIIIVDGKVDDRETEYMAQLRKVLYISDSEFKAGSILTIKEATNTIRKMTQANKEAFVYMMGQMVKVDGNVDGREAATMMETIFAADLPFN